MLLNEEFRKDRMDMFEMPDMGKLIKLVPWFEGKSNHKWHILVSTKYVLSLNNLACELQVYINPNECE